jgi:type IX secretion system PorP/SprF family membrane protein
MLKKSILPLFVLLFFVKAEGQDIHFSQYNGSLANLSPGLTGMFDGDYRVSAIYRSQWQAVPVPYKTFSMSGDMRYKPAQLKSDVIGVGILFNNDRAGDAYYGMNQFYIAGSYIHKLNKDSTMILGAGLNVGVTSAGFYYNRMTFDSQFDGSGYNSTYTTNENFKSTKTIFADLNLGLGLQYAITKKINLTYAFSMNHLSNPVISYQGAPASKLDTKFVNYLSVSVPVDVKLYAVPEILFSHQGRYNEWVPGANVRLMLDERTNNSASLGVYLRVKDAVIARLGYTFKTTTAGISYDVNTSKFLAATNRRGAFEIYVTHIIKRVKPVIIKKRVCPVYM